VNVSATVIASAGVNKARLYYKYDGTTTSVVMSNTGSTYYAVIGPFHEGATVTYYIHVTDDNLNTEDSTNRSFAVQDTNPPTITIVSPLDNAIITETMPTIQATFSDSSGINSSTVSLSVDGTDVTAHATITTTGISYTPTTPLTYDTHTVILQISDISGNDAEKSWSFVIQATAATYSELIESLPAGEIRTITMGGVDTGLDSIEFTAVNSLTDFYVMVERLAGPPEEVTSEPTQTVYTYINIQISANENDVSAIKIKFKVEKTWLDEQGIDKSNVVLLRYTNDEWQELTTTVTTEDETYVYYEAASPGFSVFAIAGNVPSGEGEQPLPFYLYIAVIIAIIAVIAVIVVLYYRGYL
jgi:PGF-pre-PGF domain-containing protein